MRSASAVAVYAAFAGSVYSTSIAAPSKGSVATAAPRPIKTTDLVLTEFVDHGAAAMVSENRGILAVRDKAGTPLVVALAHDQLGSGTRTSLLVIDARTGATQQYFYPSQNQATGDNYAVMRTLDGKIYTSFGTTFLEFDLESRAWTFNGTIDGFGMAFTRAPDGRVYFATYSTASLYCFDPATRVLEKVVQLDPLQQYPTYIEAGADGWIYAGLGTSRANIVAYNPATRELKQLLDEAARQTGTSYVMASTDGNLYGREFGSESGRIFKLEGGTAAVVEGLTTMPVRARTGAINWGNMYRPFPGGGEIISFSLPDKTGEIHLDGVTRRITFDYISNGPGVTSVTTGPGGKVYGSTNHPMHFFSLDPANGAVVDHGGIPQVASGNFGAFGTSGKYLVGDTYSSGMVYEYDPAAPFNAPATGPSVNPRPLGTFAEVSRPRSSVSLPGGDVLFGGYPAYGYTGGGLVTYSAATRTARVKPASELLPSLSTTALALLDNYTVVGGTSIETPGGGVMQAKEAELYLLDIATQSVTHRMVPVPGARSIFDLHLGPGGKVYGLTNNAQFFVFDPVTKSVVHRGDWTTWGVAFNPGNSMWNTPGGRVGVLLPRVILEILPDYSMRKVADLPVTATAGAVLLNNRLYYGAGSHLQSVGFVAGKK